MLRYAADPAWPFDVRLTTSQNSTQLGDSSVMSLSSTGGYEIWGDHVVILPLAAGTNIVRLTNEGGWGNVNYIDIVPASPPPPPPQQEMIIQRKTYSIGGQAVANRVVTFIEGVETDNQVYYIHSDHLGSVSVLTKMSDGYVVNDSKAYYTPFGDFRLQPTSDLTDMGYTGHLGNNTGSNDIGLIYMNARYYVPYLNRFISADTIVPDPANPQSYNRYSYVLNNPIRYTDPSGHCGADNSSSFGIGGIQVTYSTKTDECIQLRDELENLYDISLTGFWLLEEMELLRDSLQGIIDRFNEIGVTDSMGAFQEIWGGTTLYRNRDSGYNTTTQLGSFISVTNLTFRNSDGTDRDSSDVMGTFAHELMHVWDNREWNSLAGNLKDIVGGRGELCVLILCTSYKYQVDIQSPAPTINGYIMNSREDLAWTFKALIVDPTNLAQERINYFEGLLQEFNN